MVRILLSFAGAVAACTPSPQELAIPNSGQKSAAANFQDTAVPDPRRSAGDPQQAAPGPIPEPVSAAQNPAPALPVDSPAEALGRRTLSTAFVMASPDGRLLVELRGGRVLVLRDVVMRSKDYCGVPVSGDKAGGRYCGGYADIVAARPGGPPASEQPVPANADPVEPARSPAEPR